MEDSTAAYVAAHPERRVLYTFVPCDGSVVEGTGEMGCNGHKNRRGHAKVAAVLAQRLREIMSW